MSARNRILIIGLDGGTWRLLNPLMDEGYMPFLKSLASTGIRGVLESTDPPQTPAAWGSFHTGMNPVKNGVVDFFVWDRVARRMRAANATCLPKTLWEYLSDAGMRICSVNVPMTYPPRAVNGVVVGGILSPGVQGDFTYPKELKAALLREVPGYHIFDVNNFSAELAKHGPKSFADSMAEVERRRVDAVKFLLSRERPDVLMVHFQAIDVVQHLLWGYMDPGHRLYDQGIRDYIAGNFYRKLDEAVARVLDMYGENNRNGSMTTFVVSDHGFQAHLRKAHLGNWLWQEGLSKLNEMRKARRTMAKTLALLASLDVLRLRRLLLTSRQRNSLGTTVTALREATDFQESKAFALGGNTYGLIFLTGAAGTRRETMEHITRRLSLFVDPETGKSPVRRIIRPCDTYGDAVSDELPDILIEPEDGYTFLGPPQPGEGLFSDVTLEHFHIGTHHKDGIIVANGEGIVNGAEPIRARIIDVLPTILYAMGLPVPAHVEGAVQSSIFTPDFSAGNPVEWLPAECGEVGNQTVYSEREQKMIEERLKALGYL